MPPELAALLYLPAESLQDVVAALKHLKTEIALDPDKLDDPAVLGKLTELGAKIKQIEASGPAASHMLLAAPSFDVFSFGIVMYEMFCNRS